MSKEAVVFGKVTTSREVTTSKVLLVDIPVSNDDVQPFADAGCTIVSAGDATARLLASELWSRCDPGSTLVFFPGHGAMLVYGYLPNQWLRQWSIQTFPAMRLWSPGEDPRAWVGRAISNRVHLGIRDVVVVDDVISSGCTVRRVREMHAPWIPGASWHTVTWVMQRSARTRGYDSVIAAETVGLLDRRVPINSLSTLLQDFEISRSYLQRHFPGNTELAQHLLTMQRQHMSHT